MRMGKEGNESFGVRRGYGVGQCLDDRFGFGDSRVFEKGLRFDGQVGGGEEMNARTSSNSCLSFPFLPKASASIRSKAFASPTFALRRRRTA